MKLGDEQVDDEVNNSVYTKILAICKDFPEKKKASIEIFADIANGKGYVRVLALGPSLIGGSNGHDLVWFFDQAKRELARFVKMTGVRLITANQQQSEERIGPHISRAFLKSSASTSSPIAVARTWQ